MPSLRKFGSRENGFTLIELLVVVAIIALLISILLPSLTSARNVARMVRCQAGLKQFATAHQMYANEADNYFVPHKTNGNRLPWFRHIKYRSMLGMRPGTKYTEGLVCPSVPPDARQTTPSFNYAGNATRTNGRPDLTPQIEKNAPYHEGDYKQNGTATGTGDAFRINRSKIVRHSEVIQNYDASDWNGRRDGARYTTRWDVFPELNGGGGMFGGGHWHQASYRHMEGANFAMYDGHVEHLAKNDAYAFNGTKINWGKVNRLWQAYRKQ